MCPAFAFIIVKVLSGPKVTLSQISPLTVPLNLIVNHPLRWAPDERCGVNLIGETTKHKTHTPAERGSMNERRDPHKIVS